MKKTKLLIIGYSLGIGGVERAMLSLINTLNYSKYEVDLILFDQKGEFIKDLNPNVQILPIQDFYRWILLPKNDVLGAMLSLVFKPYLLYTFIKNIIWGILHKNMAIARQHMWLDSISYIPNHNTKYDIAYDFSGLFRRYTLEKVNASEKWTWIHSDYRVFGLDKTIDYNLLRRFDRICCVSDTCKQIFDNEFPNLSNKSAVELNKIDIKSILKQAQSGGFNDNFDGVRLLDVTRIDPNKGLDIAVHVCAKLKQLGLNFKWYILGNDPLGYQKELEALIKEYDVEKQFILLGFTKNPYPYMTQADIIVHFSRFEGRSVSIDEALALKKTILLTNYPTAKDQITNGINGYICDFDEEKLVKQIESLIFNVK